MPRRPDGSIAYSTIGDYRDAPGFSMHVHCFGGCHHSAKLDLVALCERLGADHGCLAKDLKPRFHCGKCGSRDIGFTIHHDGIKRD